MEICIKSTKIDYKGKSPPPLFLSNKHVTNYPSKQITVKRFPEATRHVLLAGAQVATQRQVLLQLTLTWVLPQPRNNGPSVWESLAEQRSRAPSAPAPLSALTGGSEDLAKSPKGRESHTGSESRQVSEQLSSEPPAGGSRALWATTIWCHRGNSPNFHIRWKPGASHPFCPWLKNAVPLQSHLVENQTLNKLTVSSGNPQSKEKSNVSSEIIFFSVSKSHKTTLCLFCIFTYIWLYSKKDLRQFHQAARSLFHPNYTGQRKHGSVHICPR